MTTKTDITADQAESMNPWELAQLLSTPDSEIQFTGDMNPFNHGGTFYETANWERYGYASCVRFEDIDGRTLVSSATITKLFGRDMKAAHNCCDTPDEYRNTVVGEIEACLGYMGAETDQDFSGDYAEWFEDCSELDAWETALPWIKGLRQ